MPTATYDRGDPYINLCLAILKTAKRDRAKMWSDFSKDFLNDRTSIEPFNVAWWVVDYIKDK